MDHALLCVDDEADNLDALERIFRRKYKVFKATSGSAALDILANEKISLIISDQRMPNMTGVEFLAKSVKIHPEAVRILLTGYTDIDSVIGAINSGQVYRYVTKPWDPNDLATAVDRGIERFELNQQLKEKNIALTAALNELKTLDEAKNHFMILINHELRTPLTVMTSFLELLNETKLDVDQKKYVQRIATGTQRLQSLIDDVLELVSAETGVKKITTRKTSLKKLLEDVEAPFRAAAEGKKQTFHIEFADATVKADVPLVRSVLARLIDNAVKFGESKSTIEITAQPLGQHQQVEIRNKGKVLSPEAIANILKPFTLDENILHHTKGTGLGLSVCRALLKAHGSELALSGSKGEFQVSFLL